MKFPITFLSLFILLSFTPPSVSAVTQPYISSHSSMYFKPKTEETKPKWIKILEWTVPIFLIVGLIFFFSSLGPAGYWGFHTIVRPLNHTLFLIAFSIAVVSALTLFVNRIIGLFKKRK